MAYNIHIGDQLTWKWGNGTASGKVVERFTSRVTRKIDGTEIVRDADEDEPAYRIEQDHSQEVLKSGSELTVE